MWEFSGRLTRLIKINSNLNGSSAIRFGISNLPFEVFQFLHSTLPSKWQSDYFSSLAFGYLSFFTFIYHRSKAARIFASRRCDAKKKKKKKRIAISLSLQVQMTADIVWLTWRGRWITTLTTPSITLFSAFFGCRHNAETRNLSKNYLIDLIF